MVLVEAAGEPGHVRVRFAASQREPLRSELELWRDSDIEALAMVAKFSDTNPAFVVFKEQERDLVTAVLAELALIPEGEDFVLSADAAILFGCIKGAAGIAAERFMNGVDGLPQGVDNHEDVDELRERMATATLWAATLLAAQPFESPRELPRQQLPNGA